MGRHPEVRLLLRVWKNVAKRIRATYGTISRAKGTKAYEAYQQAYRACRSKKKAVQKALIADIKARFRERQPLVDIANQLAGPSTEEQEHTKDELEVHRKLSRERSHAIAALFTFATSDYAEECKRRSEAIQAVTALSKCQELLVKKARQTRRTYRTEAETPAEDSTTTKCLPIECLPTQCIFCLGQSGLSLELRTKAFHSRGDLKKHFSRKHLRHYPDGEPIDCPHSECTATLSNKERLQNHAARIHKTLT